MSRDDTPSRPPAPDSGDALLQRYHEASALDPARPSPALRERVLAQARAAAAGPIKSAGVAPARGEASPEWIAGDDPATVGQGQNGSEPANPAPGRDHNAANDRSWRIRALASLAVLGLATLLLLQFDRGAPEERDLALGGPAATTAPAAPVQAPARPETPSAAAPQDPKLASADTARRERAATELAPAIGQTRSAPVQPATPGIRDAGSSAPDGPLTDSASRAGAAGPGQTAGAMKAAPPAAPVRTTEPELTAAAPPAPPAAAPPAALAAPPATQTSEARSRVLPSGAPAAGRSADAARPALDGSAAPAGQRLWAAVGAGMPDAARQALADGAPVNAVDATGQTALMLAARRGDEAMVRLLLAAGADRARSDAAGLTAAQHAARAGHAALLRLLDPAESAPPAPQR